MEHFNKMKRILLSILAIFFPWIVILFDGKFIASMACLALQLTIIGWIPASIWAFKVAKNIHLPENNDIDSTQSTMKTQEENTLDNVNSKEIIEKDLQTNSNLTEKKEDK